MFNKTLDVCPPARDLRYLSELCCVDGPSGVGRATFPVVRDHGLVRPRHATSYPAIHVSVVMQLTVWLLPPSHPQGVKMLSYLYNEAQSNCSNENYPVLLSLLKSSCEPYTR